MQDKGKYSSYQLAKIIINDLISLGIKQYYISPGYRNLPLIEALAQQDSTSIISSLDERQAVYRALGYAKSSGKVAALVCTSGTAAANYYPGVIEAYESGVPLLIISADRPYELIGTHSNQVTTQQGFFGSFCHETIAIPEDIDAKNIDVVRIKVAQVIPHTESWAKPVHINFPLRLNNPENTKFPLRKTSRKLPYLISNIGYQNEKDQEIEKVINDAKRPILLFGEAHHSDCDPYVKKFLLETSIPFYADILSGNRHINPDLEIHDRTKKSLKNNFIKYKPDLIIHLGGRLITKVWDKLIENNPPKAYIRVSQKKGIPDATCTFSHQVSCKIGDFLKIYKNQLISQNRDPHFESEISNQALPEKVNTLTVAKRLSSIIPENASVLLGNSMTIRAFDQITEPQSSITFYGNRGVSGIEGFINTALGIEDCTKSIVISIIGDISFMHDIGALFNNRLRSNLKVIVLNNFGGRIFSTLPIEKNNNPAYTYLTTPHDFRFEKISLAAGWHYKIVKSLQNLQDTSKQFLSLDGPGLMEIAIPPDNEDSPY